MMDIRNVKITDTRTTAKSPKTKKDESIDKLRDDFYKAIDDLTDFLKENI